MDKLEQAFEFRHACKKFDNTKKISQQDIEYILAAGRQSPSAFGLEPWHFVIVDNDNIKSQLRSVCYNQEQVTSCSHFVIVLYRKANNFTLQSEYLRRTIARTLPDGSDQTAIDNACQSVLNFYHQGLAEGLTIDLSSEMQDYIACANMLTAAAYREIDSCVIGGFQYDGVVQILEKYMPKFSRESFGIGLCLAFGYRVSEPDSHKRWPLADLTTYLTESN